MPSPRKLSFDILLKILRDESYSNLSLDAALERADLDGRDTAFVTALVYGVLERQITLDHMISHFAGREVTKLKPQVLCVLRLGAYQLMYMDKVPSSAAVNESVKLAKTGGCAYAAGLVNAVLRKIASNLDSLPWPNKEPDYDRYLSVRYSCPLWLVKKWRAAYGDETAEPLIESLAGRPPAVARVNTLKGTPEGLIERLKGEGIEAVVSSLLPEAVELSSLPALRHSKAFGQGLFILQDYASQLCCRAVGPQPGERVLDLCAAPGGKSFTMGFMMDGTGEITSCDLYDSRLALIAEGAKRLGLEGVVHPRQNDASQPNDSVGMADRVLCDVPCSGLGVIRRKPEIKFKKQETFDLLPDLQYSILCEGARHVAPGGRLVYSTCTLNLDENESVAERFLRENPSFMPDPLDEALFGRFLLRGNMVTLMPHLGGTDGFFIAVFKRFRG